MKITVAVCLAVAGKRSGGDRIMADILRPGCFLMSLTGISFKSGPGHGRPGIKSELKGRKSGGLFGGMVLTTFARRGAGKC